MAIGPLTVTSSRSEVVDFTTPYLSFGIGVLFRIPQVQRPSLFSFMKPLSSQIWISMIVAGLVTIIFAYVIARVTPYEWHAPRSLCAARHARDAYYSNHENLLINNYTMANSSWYVMTTFLKGCAHFAPKSISTRLLGGIWWVFCLVMISAYTANLAAVLTVDRRFLPIKSLEDLAYQDEITFGAYEGGSTAQFFKEARIPAHKKMWERMEKARPSVFVRNNSEGLARVKSENYAFLMESSFLEYFVAKECNLTPIGAALGSSGHGIALKKGSPWTDKISSHILNYGEKGKLEKIKTLWWKVKAQGSSCQQTVSASTMKEERISLNMDSVAGLFLILLAGLCLAVVFGILEFIVKNKQNATIQHRSVWSEMAQELCFALRMPRSSRRHHINRRCSRCDQAAVAVPPAQCKNRRFVNTIRGKISHDGTNAPCSSNMTMTTSGGSTVVPVTMRKSSVAGSRRNTCNDPNANSTFGAHHRVGVDVVEFHENGKLLEHHDTATTLSSSLSCFSAHDKLGPSCSFDKSHPR